MEKSFVATGLGIYVASAPTLKRGANVLRAYGVFIEGCAGRSCKWSFVETVYIECGNYFEGEESSCDAV